MNSQNVISKPKDVNAISYDIVNNAKPTSKFYGLFQHIFDFYNDHLFGGAIKDCVIVITRKSRVMGHFSYKRWYHKDEKDTDELAVNPSQFHKYPLIEICQTIVHEMVHAWQYHYGKPSNRGYHNKQFAEKMIEVGLMPSSTGKPGGKDVGQNMADYPIEGGSFLKYTELLMNSDIFSQLYFEVSPKIVTMIDQDKPLFDQIKDLIPTQETNTNSKPKAKSKIKYSCSCSNVWGKPGLVITCNSCQTLFKPNLSKS